MTLDVTVGGIDIRPYHWKEQENPYTLTMDAEVSKEDFNRLNALRLNVAKHTNYFDVMVEDYIKMMRFGKVIYSEHEDFMKVRMTLIEKDYSREGEKHYEEPGRENLLETVSHLQLTNRKLLQLLQEKNILTEEEAESVKVHAADDILNREFQFYQVEDIDFYQEKITI